MLFTTPFAITTSQSPDSTRTSGSSTSFLRTRYERYDLFPYVTSIGNRQGQIGILFNQQNCQPLPADRCQRVHQLFHDDGRQSQTHLVDQQQDWSPPSTREPSRTSAVRLPTSFQLADAGAPPDAEKACTFYPGHGLSRHCHRERRRPSANCPVHSCGQRALFAATEPDGIVKAVANSKRADRLEVFDTRLILSPAPSVAESA